MMTGIETLEIARKHLTRIQDNDWVATNLDVITFAEEIAKIERESRKELLEALEGMVEMVEMNGFMKPAMMDIARSAIRKAKGE